MKKSKLTYKLRPTEYRIDGYYGGDFVGTLYDPHIIEFRQLNKKILWGVRQGCGLILNKSGEWEYEPLPSNRDDLFLERCRFKSLKSAWAALKAILPPIKKS